jgi:hypothetical protein
VNPYRTALSKVPWILSPLKTGYYRRWDKMRKSSRMIPITGPYLTTELALGDVYWEAEREQEEADRAILEIKHEIRKTEYGY